MTPPLLKLAFVQGPRDGESLEYRPGSTIRIGRIVRGNEIAVKDAGVSTKHLRIVSDSDNWIIHDLGSSNGTVLNSETLDEDTPVSLRHGDVIKLGECTSIVVNFEAREEEHKLPPRPRRNNRRLPVSDPDPVPVESVQEKPTRKGRVGRPRKNEKKVAVTDEEEEAVSVEKRRNFRVKGCKNSEAVQDLGLSSVKSEVEDTPKEVKRGTRSRQNQNVKCEDSEEMRIPSRGTRSRREEIGGDSYLELDMVLRQARAKKKKKIMEQKSLVEEMEARNEDAGDEKGRSETSDKEDERVAQVESESRNSAVVAEEDLNCSVREGGETENLQDSKGEEGGVETSDGRCDEKEKAGERSRTEKKVDLEKMTLGDWFTYMEVYLRKKIVDETEEKIEAMRAKSLRVHQYIAEQKQAKGKGSVS